jgi:hypothetical protein
MKMTPNTLWTVISVCATLLLILADTYGVFGGKILSIIGG